MTPEKEPETKAIRKTNPDYYQGDFFSAILKELKLKSVSRYGSDKGFHNLFSLSKKKRQNPIRHIIRDISRKQTTTITVRNDHGSGIATVFDQDIILFLTSLIVKELDETGSISARPVFSPADYFHFKGIKKASGREHKLFQEAIERLQNTFVEITQDDRKQTRIQFNWISFSAAITNEPKTRVICYAPESPNTILEAILQHQGITIDRSYFKITSPIQRYLYLYARKAVGRQVSFTESIDSLYKKTGSEDTKRAFKHQLKKLEGKPLGAEPWVYTLQLDGDKVTFHGRGQVRAINQQKLQNLLGSLTASKRI